ncbi:MAG: hypothetical protein ACR2NI_12920 [Pirellulales bacterium]
MFFVHRANLYVLHNQLTVQNKYNSENVHYDDHTLITYGCRQSEFSPQRLDNIADPEAKTDLYNRILA